MFPAILSALGVVVTVVEVLRAATALLWSLVLASMAGSAIRSVIGMHRVRDDVWTFAFFIALHQLGYAMRWQWGWSHRPEPGGDTATLVGLAVLSALIATGLLVHRHKFEGFRW